MTVTNEPADIDRRILFALNDAGEEYVSALINTIIECEGSPSEVTSVASALKKFLRGSIVKCAVARDTNTLALIELAEREAIQRLNALPEQMAWSQEDFLWIWTSDQPRLIVLLTDDGTRMSQEMATGIEAEMIRTFLSVRAKDPRWYREYKKLSENP